jgi:TonB family protein
MTSKRLIVAGIAALLAGTAAGEGRQRSLPEWAPPVPIKTVEPKISPLLYAGGVAVFAVTVEPDGSVSDIRTVTAAPGITEPAAEAVRQWRFRPARSSGGAVRAATTVAVQVVLVRTGAP